MALSPLQRIELERLISDRRDTLAAELREDVGRARDEEYPELAGPVTDAGDQASADLLSDLDTAEVSRDLGMLRELDAALARLAEGTYGVCVDCHGEIEYERLRAQPAALRCFDCQRAHEKTFAHPGQPTL